MVLNQTRTAAPYSQGQWHVLRHFYTSKNDALAKKKKSDVRCRFLKFTILKKLDSTVGRESKIRPSRPSALRVMACALSRYANFTRQKRHVFAKNLE